MKANHQIALFCILFYAIIVLSRLWQALAFVATCEVFCMMVISFLMIKFFKIKDISLLVKVYFTMLCILLVEGFLAFGLSWSALLNFVNSPISMLLAIVFAYTFVNYFQSFYKRAALLVSYLLVLSLAANVFIPMLTWEQNTYRSGVDLNVKSNINFDLVEFDTTNTPHLKDKIVVLGVWNSGCGYCKKLLRHMNILSEKEYNLDTTVVFMAINDGKIDKSDVALYANKIKPVTPEIKYCKTSDKNFYINLGYYGAPSMIILRNKKILSVVNGYIIDAKYNYEYFIERELDIAKQMVDKPR